jgi:predicted secreted protein
VNLFTGIAIFLTLWWTVLFAVLPLGSQSHAEAGIKPPAGGDPASPVNPRLKEKFLLTTVISAVLFVLLFLVIHFELISVTPLRRVS